VNQNLDPFEFTMKYLLEGSDQAYQQKESIATILAAAKSAIAREILEKGTRLDKILKLDPESQDRPETSLQHAIRFWINVS
jgi:hypothetical protein